jgi:hypothetical protein
VSVVPVPSSKPYAATGPDEAAEPPREKDTVNASASTAHAAILTIGMFDDLLAVGVNPRVAAEPMTSPAGAPTSRGAT